MKFYENHREMSQLWHVEDLLADEFNRDLDRARDNQYVVLMDEPSLKLWEDVLSIVHEEGESVEFRRERIINRLTNKPPFNLNFLRDKISLLFGDGFYTAFYDNTNMRIVLEGTPDSPQRLKEIYITIMSIKPSNIEYLYHASDKLDWTNKLFIYTWPGIQQSELILEPPTSLVVVLKNLIENGDFSDGTNGWNPNSSTITVANNGSLKVENNGTQGYAQVWRYIYLDPMSKYYFRAKLGVGNTDRPVYLTDWFSGGVTSSEGVYELLKENTSEEINRQQIKFTKTTTLGDYYYIGNIQLINLTETFGAGNEPSKEWMDELIEQIGYFEERTVVL